MSPERKVFCIGLPKTGTSSLREAMRQLGYRVMSDPFGADLLDALNAGDYTGLGGRAERYDVFSDLSIAAHWEGIMRANPDALYLATWRDGWAARAHRWLSARPGATACDDGLAPTARSLLTLWLAGRIPSVSWLAELQVNHTATVQTIATLHGRRIAWLDICGGDGWQQLCRALAPTNPFPHVRPT